MTSDGTDRSKFREDFSKPENRKVKKEAVLKDMIESSKFIRKAIAGTFKVRSYTYLRPDFNYESTKFIDPMSIIMYAKKENRRVDALYVCVHYGVEIGDYLRKQVRQTTSAMLVQAHKYCCGDTSSMTA